jgi:transcriptional regulator
MYTPQHFRVDDRAVLHDLMCRFSFATLVTTREGRPIASHLPFLVYPDGGEYGRLVGHMARSNEQWRDFGAEEEDRAGLSREALAIFQGPHTYISPSWYETHPSVPTWNYMVAHAYGVPRILTDEAQVRQILQALVALHEEEFDAPWRMDLPDEYLHRMMRGIVAFEMPIMRLEGKFKLSQNRSARDRERVIAALARDPDAGAQGVRAAMRDLG